MSSTPQIRRWQFSLRAVLILMTVVAAVVAFAATRPVLALTIAVCTAGTLFLIGATFFLVAYLTKIDVFAQRPHLAAIAWLVAGLMSVAVSSRLAWVQFHPKYFGTYLPQLSAAIAFGGFSGFCFWLLWKSFQLPTVSDPDGSAEQPARS